MSFKFHRIEQSLLEGVIARGDRRIGAVIEAAYHNGARMDSWNEHFNHAAWQQAFEETGIDPDSVRGELAPDAPTPWSHIHCRRSQEQLADEYRQMLAELDE